MKANSFIYNRQGNIEMITMGIVAAVTFAIAIPIIFNVVGAIPISTIDTNIKTNVLGLQAVNPTDAQNATWNATIPCGNATGNLLTQINSFFSIGPIYLVVVIAVGIIAAILVIRKFS